jgi:hypothetical protein
MMSMEDKIKMYQEKKTFIKGISAVFEKKPAGSSVERIDYEVFHKIVVRDENTYHHFVEFVIVRFEGGGKSVKVVSGNSNTANFRVIGPMLDGGYYDENSYYDSMIETGYDLVALSGEDKLKEALSKPMEHIRDVRECFNYCKDGNDVEKVIKMIPNCFGSFTVEYGDDEETFTIINYYEENGVDECEEVEYEFYEED